MKTIIRNFTSIFRKFVTANLLNLLGLSLAFERLFRLTMELGSGMEDYGVTLPRPLVEQLAAASPHIKGYGIEQCWTNFDQFLVGDQEYSLNLLYGIHDFMSVFKPTVICGDLKGLNQLPNIVLPRSEAMRIFGTVHAVGKTLTILKTISCTASALGVPMTMKATTTTGTIRLISVWTIRPTCRTLLLPCARKPSSCSRMTST